MMDFWIAGSGSLQHPSSWFTLVILLELSGNCACLMHVKITWGYPGGSVVKISACQMGDAGLILGLGRFPGGGNGNPLQYSCLENPMDREAWWAAVHGVTDSWIQLSDWAHTQRWLAVTSLKVFKNIVLPWIYVFIHNILKCEWQVSILFLDAVT